MSTTDTPADQPADTAPRRPAGARDVLRSLGRGRVLVTLLVGFGAGVPFLLTGNTLGYWLRDAGTTLAAIGFLSWVGLAYSFKFVWAPVVDQVNLPLLGRLGRRRGWLLLSQAVVGLSLLGMALVGPAVGADGQTAPVGGIDGRTLLLLGGFALSTAFASATQDIVADAWRIESAEDADDLGLLTAAFSLGYRLAILWANSLILFVVAGVGWPLSYGVCAALMAVALVATLAAREPPATEVAEAAQRPLWSPRGFLDAVVGPFLDFLRRHRSAALLMLAAISLYRLADFVMGPMVNPLYADVGLAKPTVASVRLIFGVSGAVAGIALAGLSAIRLGFVRTLIIGAVLGPLSNVGFSLLALSGGSLPVFSAVMFVDDFSAGYAGAALVAYMSSLTSLGYTATQYALLSSFYALLGKFLKGFSGGAVEALQVGRSLTEAYALFFAGTALIGIPAVVLSLWLGARLRRDEAAAQPSLSSS